MQTKSLIAYLCDNNWSAPGTDYKDATAKRMPNGKKLILTMPEEKAEGHKLSVMDGYCVESEIKMTDGAPVIAIIEAIEAANA